MSESPSGEAQGVRTDTDEWLETLEDLATEIGKDLMEIKLALLEVVMRLEDLEKRSMSSDDERGSEA